MRIIRLPFRAITLILVIYFWWLGVGNGLYIGASSGYMTNWGGGLRYLTNWVLILNLLVAVNAVMNEHLERTPFNFIIPATLSMNFVVIALYWGLRIIDKSYLDVNTEDWSTFEWLWDFYLHWGMSILLLIELFFFNKSSSKTISSYFTLMVIFFSYIFWIELIIMPNNDEPCGNYTCGFPYPFLNEMELSDRNIFYFGVWVLGTVSFVLARVILWASKKVIMKELTE
ncbi:MAG: hypothetical protein CMM49_07510 [Rhodospirillaceae bacterium]|nr:hypothetical protein [Rhodospirillaceae bacterium]|tara:strand:+ start:1383 stop:2066 length:684 start_codon:yes stop_codon:yes gene_type:complete